MLLFFLQECIKLIKSDSKDIYNVIKDLKKKKNLNPKKKYGFTKILSSTTEFNIDIRKKCFLISKLAY